MSAADGSNPAAKFVRQKRLVIALGVLLVLAGIVMLTSLTRLAMPLRLMAGLGDIFIGCVLLVMVAQSKPPGK